MVDRWFGHLEQKCVDDWVSACRVFEVPGDLRLLGLKKEWAQDRVRWRGLISGNRPTRAGMETRTLNR